MIDILYKDCYEHLLNMDDNSINLFIQDTPFGVTQNEWDIAPDLDKMWKEWIRVGTEDCQFVFFGTQPFVSQLVNSNLTMFKYDWIWQKTDSTNFLNAKHQPLRIHEHVLVFYKKSKYNAQGLRKFDRLKKDSKKITTTNYGATKGEQHNQQFTNYPESIFTFDSANNTVHPTQKPIDLIRYLIRTYSNEGDNVFDGYSGSGTTACACFLEKRNGIVCETNKKYYDESIIRYRNLTAQLTLL